MYIIVGTVSKAGLALLVSVILNAFQGLHCFWARTLVEVENKVDRMDNFSFPIVARKFSGKVTLQGDRVVSRVWCCVFGRRW